MTGVAVYVTEVPEQTVPAEAAIDTLTGKVGLTVMVMVLEVAGFPATQLNLEVITHFTLSLLAGAYM